jgi:hypothetical protein
MTKTEFQDLLQRYTHSTRNEADELLALKKQYPFSQLLHSLAARVSKDHRLENHEKELQLAAVYAADRHVLKEIMLKASMTSENGGAALESVHKTIDTVDYADEVMHDLELLHESKHKFEMLVENQTKREVQSVANFKKTDPRVKRVSDSKPVKKVVSPAKKSKKAVTSKAKATRHLSPSKKKVAKATSAKRVAKLHRSKPARAKKHKDTSDELISHIEKTKRRLKPNGQRQREQIQIIDQFIKTQPSISNMRDRVSQVPGGDLVNLKQGEFGEQVISETLVSILVRQGKKDKAIEVLRKLIWKFPQKKAYFAARIEELKK